MIWHEPFTLREPTKEELGKWKKYGEINMFALKFVQRLWEEGIIKTRQRQLIQSEIFRRWNEEHWEFNPYLKSYKEDKSLSKNKKVRVGK